MLNPKILEVIKLASAKENTPELAGFWEKQYVQLLTKKELILDSVTIETVLDSKNTNQFIPIGYVDILNFLKDSVLDEMVLQNVLDVVVRFLDNLLDVKIHNINEQKNPSSRNIEIILSNKNEFYDLQNLNQKSKSKYNILFAQMIFKASEFLAEEKGSFGNLVNVAQEIKPIEYQFWINENGKIVGNGKKISEQFDTKSILKTSYTVIPRRNYQLFENTNSTPNSQLNPLSDSIINISLKKIESKEKKISKLTKEKQPQKGSTTKGSTTKIMLVASDGFGKILTIKNLKEHCLPEVEFDNSTDPVDFLTTYMLESFSLSLGYLEIVSSYFDKVENSLIIAFSCKIKPPKQGVFELTSYDNKKLFDPISSEILDKYISRNKLLSEFKDLLATNPSILKNIKNQKNINEQKIQQVKQKTSPVNIVFREYDIETESFSRVRIKVGIDNGKIKRLEFLLNEDFKYRYATFYSSFAFITSFLNYMLSMDEDIEKVINFLESNMGMQTSLGLVSKVVYYSLQSLQKIVS